MKRYVYAFLAGGAFAFGLGLSGMTQPSKIKGFLDFFGDWDATMLFVLGPAVGIYLLGTWIAGKVWPRKVAACPAPERMGARFFLGSAVFGIGWGLAGVCPGPSLVILGQGSVPALTLFVAMLAGIVVSDQVLARR